MRRVLIFIAIVCVLSLAVYAALPTLKRGLAYITRSTANLEEVRAQVAPRLEAELSEVGLALGQEVFVRIFKEERILEVWLRGADHFTLFKTYPICNFSGGLGPKLKEGDRQSPEGFYTVDPSALNPNSSYHLSFNLGFPNPFDRANARTGSYLMVHGRCLSVGCYAMTDAGIEEIYLLVEAALKAGQRHVPVHAFPFKMTEERLAREQDNPWYDFWANLKTGYDLFEEDHYPPPVSVSDKAYVFEP